MKGRIDAGGVLYIERGTKLKKQECPYRPVAACNDKCPKFGNPQKKSDSSTWKYLEICDGAVLEFSELIDKRV